MSDCLLGTSGARRHPTVKELQDRGWLIVPYLQSAVLNCLRQAAGGVVSPTQLVEYVWPDPNDEPEYAISCVRCAVFHLRRRGFTMIKTIKSRGYYFAPTIASFHPSEVLRDPLAATTA